MPTKRTISQIAQEIKKTWSNVNYAAKPYLNVMQYLEDKNDRYFEESADDIVLRFLANAQTWKGDDARRIKAELKSLLK